MPCVTEFFVANHYGNPAFCGSPNKLFLCKNHASFVKCRGSVACRLLNIYVFIAIYSVCLFRKSFYVSKERNIESIIYLHTARVPLILAEEQTENRGGLDKSIETLTQHGNGLTNSQRICN